MKLPSRNVRVFIYGNIAGIGGWWQYVVENGMDQFALGSLQTFVGALVAAYMMRKDDDKPGLRKAPPESEDKIRAVLREKRQGRVPRYEAPLVPLRDREPQDLPDFHPPQARAVPREPRFPAAFPRSFEETLPLPPMNFSGDQRDS